MKKPMLASDDAGLARDFLHMGIAHGNFKRQKFA
jgi:hypothetical protein